MYWLFLFKICAAVKNGGSSPRSQIISEIHANKPEQYVVELIRAVSDHKLIIESSDECNILVPAIMRNMHLVVEKLLDIKADPNKVDTCNMPSETGEHEVISSVPLIIAAYGSTARMVQLLLNAGADPNPQNVRESSLVSSIRSNTEFTQKVLMLIQARADVNAKCEDGFSTNHVVDAYGNWQRTVVDRSAGAEADVTTPLMTAVIRARSHPVARSVFMSLLSANADVNFLDKHGRGALWLSMSNITLFHLLRRRGALVTDAMKTEVNEVNTESGLTPLMEAIASADVSRVDVLISARANINAETANGVTPLMMALARNNHIFRILVLNGARITPELRTRAVQLNDLNSFTWAEDEARDMSIRHQLG